MKIKTYIVNTLTEAYPLIIKDLGKDAVILKTKTVKSGRFWGLFRKKQIEVVAAADFSEKTKQRDEVYNNAVSSTLPNEEKANQDVLKELSEMKSLIRSLTKEGTKEMSIPNKLEKWVLHLRDQEVDGEVINYIVKKMKMKYPNIEIMSSEEIEKTLLFILEQLIDEGKAKDTSPPPYLITLVGPTGVGKTTTIAKLAAIHVLQQRQRVGLLTTDTYRVAAVEQLKTYAKILNIPVEVVSNPDQLNSAIDALNGCRTIFMDSAGRNYLEDEYIEEINQFLKYDAPQENYLVLSMTTRWRDMRGIVEKMKSVPIDKLILTKWDETTCYGAVLNMLYHYPYPLSYISIGQGVPQDIMPADSLYIAKKILGVDDNDTRSSAAPERII